jgi:hypothetical protein
MVTFTPISVIVPELAVGIFRKSRSCNSARPLATSWLGNAPEDEPPRVAVERLAAEYAMAFGIDAVTELAVRQLPVLPTEL